MYAISLLFLFDAFTGFIRDSVKGAATTLNAAVNPELNKPEEFVYYSNCKPKLIATAAM